MSKGKTCGECKNRFSDEGTCPVRFGVTDTDDASKCDTFEPKVITNGDRIRQGGNKGLIIFSEEWSCFHCAYLNGIERKCEMPEGKDCFDGIEAWLNAPADCIAENGESAKQADLCCKSAKKSEAEDE